MSKEILDQFIQQISDSEELQTKIGEEMDCDAFIALGAEHGCEFSAEDLTAGAELSDEELDGVSGGLIHIINIAASSKGPKYRIGNKYNSGVGFSDVMDGSANTI